MASSNTQKGNSPNPVAILKEIADVIQNNVLESIHDAQDFIAQPRVRHWLRIIVIVAAYILVRPLIELFFKKLFERQSEKEEAELKKKREEEDAQLIAEGLAKPKKDANSVRIGGGGSSNNDGDAQKSAVGDKAVQDNKSNANNINNNNNKSNNDYDNSDDEDFAEKIRASGVLEWGRDARKRQKRNVKIEAETKKKGMDEEKLLELLDWSEGEADGQQ